MTRGGLRWIGGVVTLGLLIVGGAGSLGGKAGTALAAENAAPDGKAVFAAQKCNLCHTIQAQSVARTLKTSKAPDLSNVGSLHDAAWLERWLKQEETIKGQKHQKKFGGSSEELTALVKFLGSLKDAK